MSSENTHSTDEQIRLSKLMSQQGLCSRREADRLIEKGLVQVDGKIIDQLGTKVSPNAKVTLLERGQKDLDQQKTFVIYKPVGWVSGQPEDNHPAAVDLLQPENPWSGDSLEPFPENSINWLRGLAPAGRLDIDSEGLLIMTQRGSLAKTIIGPNSNIEKEYLVRFTGPWSEEKHSLLRHGLKLDGKPLKPCQVEVIDKDFIKMILIEGKKRQIRRMLEQIDLQVVSLKRVRIGQLRLGSLPKGQWRLLGPDESFV